MCGCISRVEILQPGSIVKGKIAYSVSLRSTSMESTVVHLQAAPNFHHFVNKKKGDFEVHLGTGQCPWSLYTICLIAKAALSATLQYACTYCTKNEGGGGGGGVFLKFIAKSAHTAWSLYALAIRVLHCCLKSKCKYIRSTTLVTFTTFEGKFLIFNVTDLAWLWVREIVGPKIFQWRFFFFVTAWEWSRVILIFVELCLASYLRGGNL